MVAQRYQPLRQRILSRSPTLRLAELREPLARRRVGLLTAGLLQLDGSLDSRETGRMPLGWKLVIDSTNAAALADIWAAALEYEVEDPSALISQLQVTSPRREVPERQSGNNRLHIDVHSEPEGLDELVTRLEKLGQPVYARSMRDLQDAGGSCNTPEAMSSARRKPTSTLQEERSPITGRGPQCITCEVGSCRSRSAHCGRQESRAG